jgi:hypothetical protein
MKKNVHEKLFPFACQLLTIREQSVFSAQLAFNLALKYAISG